MRRLTKNRVNPKVSLRLVLGLLVASTILAGQAFSQNDEGALTPSRAREGCLLYRSPLSGRYETVPLVHTDVALDVRGLVAAATVTQQYVNNTPSGTREMSLLDWRGFALQHSKTVSRGSHGCGGRRVSLARSEDRARRPKRASPALPISGSRADRDRVLSLPGFCGRAR